MMKTIQCEKCGNTGDKASLYLTIDAKWDGEVWTLEEREDEGGAELDCLECDHRTPFPGEDGETPFPYGMTLKIGRMAAAIVHDPRARTDADLAEAADGDTCTACGRDSLDCSRDPCAAVIADREA
jgi:hypothetical protein